MGRRGVLLRPPGLVPYARAYAEMHDLAERRVRDEIPDTLILLEHAPVYTLGRRTDPSHVRWTREQIEHTGAEVFEVDRGGSVTFHGPGQLVGYPILDLGPKPDAIQHLRRIEDAVIRAAADVGVEVGRDPEATGVWAGHRKVCALGVKLTQARVTLHGFALNCTTDLAWYDAIVPCGLHDRSVTTLSELAGRTITVEHMAPIVAYRFEEVFGLRLRLAGPEPVGQASATSA
jgi:lipoyl(octanoyl) transferase